MQNKNQKRFSEQAKKVFEGIRFDVYQWQQKLFNGKTATYEIVKRLDSVVVFGVDNNKIIIVKEKQPHWDKEHMVVVAGGMNKGEEPEVAARREFEEETGLVMKDFELVSVTQEIPGVEWFIYVFIARNVVATKEKQLDGGEQNEIMRISFKEMVRMFRNREFLYGSSFVETYLLQNKEDELKKLFLI